MEEKETTASHVSPPPDSCSPPLFSKDSYVQPRFRRFAVVPQTNLFNRRPLKGQSEQVSHLQLVLYVRTARGIGPGTELGQFNPHTNTLLIQKKEPLTFSSGGKGQRRTRITDLSSSSSSNQGRVSPSSWDVSHSH